MIMETIYSTFSVYLYAILDQHSMYSESDLTASQKLHHRSITLITTKNEDKDTL